MGVIVQMFEWDWNSVADECTNFIGPAGYGYVQGITTMESIQGDEWWTSYQAVSYTLTSKRGTKEELASMVSTCHDAGVSVIIDILFNAMAGIDSGTGIDGSTFTHYDYPDLCLHAGCNGSYDSDNFHYCGTTDNDIEDWNNVWQVQNCQLDNLADLKTESESVREKLAAHANDLLAISADGFRMDSAKEIPVEDITNITSRFIVKPSYITQETYFASGNLYPSNYTVNGDAQEFNFPTTVKAAFTNNETSISELEYLNETNGWVESDFANIFVADHDTERNNGSLSAISDWNTYVNAHVFMLAYPYGHPTVLSSYQFNNTDEGAPNNGTGTCNGTTGLNGWYCQHRWTEITGMVAFREIVGDAELTNWVSPQYDRIAFGRGTLGFVGINNDDGSWSGTFTTSLPDGTYCEVTSTGTDPVDSDGVCTGESATVLAGALTATIYARSSFAIHTGAIGTARTTIPTVDIIFEETATTTWGESIYLVGSIPELGNWDTDSAIALSSADYPVWTVAVSIETGVYFEYKFIRIETDDTVEWESDPNRAATAPTSGSLTLVTTWR
ncbi:glycoside hydrolase family 13 protein [Fistulina hepatica ATCC 64428]|uniref:Alpha-amylase n=1 Tax=Fistulina hepatica ATCC 64428 TaxID=1128425 RepID=A0A0D7APG0_9AGAR|nr:glycoside hydrolase family 13 protein [Fistulina hepatica ATCC 64428]